MAVFDIEITDADVIEETSEALVTAQEADESVRIRDHQIAVNTAQELIRQRGILMEDLELALNACRRHRATLFDHSLPDPFKKPISELLIKYKMEDFLCRPGRQRDRAPTRPELEKPKPKELENPCKCGRSARLRFHSKQCPLRKSY